MSGIEQLANLVSPKFTREELENVLKTITNSSTVSIEKVNFGPPSKKGDSYLSAIVRFSVDYTTKSELGKYEKHTTHMIAKLLPKNVGRRKTFRSSDYFRNEVDFYTKVWPILDDFQKSKKVKEPFQNIPKFLSSWVDGMNDYIVMEDLSHQRYANVQRHSGLSLEETKRIIKLFAKFHALALAYKDQHPDEFFKTADKIQEVYFAEKYREWYAKFQANVKNVAKDAVRKELSQIYVDKLNNVFDNDLYGEMCKSCCERGPLAVFTHGDPWIPNFLLQYDETHSHLEDVVIIDFQLTRCCSLSLDILFFIYTCTDSSFLDEHFDEIIECYQKTFAAFLRELGSKEDLLTLDILKADLKNHGAFGIGIGTEAIIISVLEDDEISDFDEIEGEEAVPLDTVWLVKNLTSKDKRQRVANIVKHAVDAGII